MQSWFLKFYNISPFFLLRSLYNPCHLPLGASSSSFGLASNSFLWFSGDTHTRLESYLRCTIFALSTKGAASWPSSYAHTCRLNFCSTCRAPTAVRVFGTTLRRHLKTYFPSSWRNWPKRGLMPRPSSPFLPLHTTRSSPADFPFLFRAVLYSRGTSAPKISLLWHRSSICPSTILCTLLRMPLQCWCALCSLSRCRSS